jgi:hypothetical protein
MMEDEKDTVKELSLDEPERFKRKIRPRKRNEP